MLGRVATFFGFPIPHQYSGCPTLCGSLDSPELWRWSSYRFYYLGEEGPARDQPVQRVIGEGLVARGVFVIGDAPDVSVIAAGCAASHMEVVTNREHGLAGRGR